MITEVDKAYATFYKTPLMQKAVYTAASACCTDMETINELMELLTNFSKKTAQKNVALLNAEAITEAEQILEANNGN